MYDYSRYHVSSAFLFDFQVACVHVIIDVVCLNLVSSASCVSRLCGSYGSSPLPLSPFPSFPLSLFPLYPFLNLFFLRPRCYSPFVYVVPKDLVQLTSGSLACVTFTTLHLLHLLALTPEFLICRASRHVGTRIMEREKGMTASPSCHPLLGRTPLWTAGGCQGRSGWRNVAMTNDYLGDIRGLGSCPSVSLLISSINFGSLLIAHAVKDTQNLPFIPYSSSSCTLLHSLLWPSLSLVLFPTSPSAYQASSRDASCLWALKVGHYSRS